MANSITRNHTRKSHSRKITEMGQFATGVRVHATAFARNPTNLLLLFVLPPIVIVLYGEAMELFSMVMSASAGYPFRIAGRITGAVFATAFLTGIIGLFQVISARRGDERLVLCGFSRTTLLATRLVTVIGAALLAAGVSLAVLWITISVNAPFTAFGALLAGGITYGLLGMCVGALIPRELEGSLVLVFIVDVDVAITSGLFTTTTAVPSFFPLYHSHSLLESAVLNRMVAAGHVLGTGVYILMLALLAFVIYSRMIGVRGGST
jgi:ABC-2 type transport system permease protein